jgi:predicted aldo/keto reductase-like oxidoreductase
MGVIAMKPLGGGLFGNAHLCFRYLMQFEGVVADPGIERAAEMREIAALYAEPRRLTPGEEADIARIRADMGDVWCHRCNYCQPCPQNVPISQVLLAEAVVRRLEQAVAMKAVGGFMRKAATCAECRDCVGRCPYDLDIPELLKKQIACWDGYRRTGSWAPL